MSAYIADGYVTIHSDGDRGIMVVEADGGTRRSRGAAHRAAERMARDLDTVGE